MQPLDPLDQLLRGRPAHSWTERLRSAVAERWPWFVAGAVIVSVVAIVLVMRAPSPPVAVSLPRATSVPVVGASASALPTAAPPTAAPGSTVATSATMAAGSPEQLVVHVAGAVVAPGLVTLPAGSRVADAVERAGGLRPDADGDRVNLAAPLTDGVRVYIPVMGQPDPPPAIVVTGGAAEGAAAAPSAAAPVDLNSATEAQLEALPGVGPSTAAAIVAYRTEHQRFRTVDELQEVRGIGPAKFEAIESMVTVGP